MHAASIIFIVVVIIIFITFVVVVPATAPPLVVVQRRDLLPYWVKNELVNYFKSATGNAIAWWHQHPDRWFK